MVAFMPPVTVDKPTPAFPLRYGVLQAAIGPLELPVHARGGSVQYNEAMCGGGQGYEVNCLEALDLKDFNDAGLNLVAGFSFIVMSNYVCALSTDFTEGFAEQMALQKFFSVEQAVVESIYSEGTFGTADSSLSANPDLINLDAIDLGATGVVDAISILERAIYCDSQYGPPAYLHMPIPVFNQLKSQHLIDYTNGRWRTPMGSVIVAGCIFSESPDDSGTFQIYATGQMAVWRTNNAELEQPPVQGSLNRTTNQYNGLVEREYAVTFECAVYQRTVTLWPAPTP